MIETFKWLGAIELVGLAAFPLAYAAFPAMRDRGIGFAKPVGLLVISFAVWLISYAGLLPNQGWVYGLMIGVLAVVGSPYVLRHWRSMLALFRLQWRGLLVGEALFILIFFFWVFYRAYDPAISGTEKPMDFLFLNASIIATEAPPEDPWLAGHSISYYYFGYWMLGGLAQMTAIPSYIAFNLSLALIAALAGGAVFSLVYSLVARDGGRGRDSILSGVIGVVLLMFVGNLAGLWEGLASAGIGTNGFYDWLAIDQLDRNEGDIGWRPTEHWWWWRSSRVINTFDYTGASLDYTIQEFPFFSFLLGDLHPHVIGMPFVIVGLGAIAGILMSRDRWGLSWLRSHPASAGTLALLIGLSGFISIWDITLLAGALVLVALIRGYVNQPESLLRAWLRAMSPVVVVLGVAILAVSPFYFGTFTSQVQYPEYFSEFLSRSISLLPIGPAVVGTRPIHFFTVWGLLFAVATPFMLMVMVPLLKSTVYRLRQTLNGEASVADGSIGFSISTIVLAALAVGAPYFIWAVAHLAVNQNASAGDMLTRALTAGPLGLLAASLVLVALVRSGSKLLNGATFALAVAGLASYLLYGVELLYIHDFFGNRMNTVFKLYYQAWIIFAIVAAYGFYHWRFRHQALTGLPRLASSAGYFLVGVMLVGGLYYSIAAIDTKADGFKGTPNLDGLAYISTVHDDERRAIEWLREQGHPGDLILEAIGDGYSEFGRISSSTGVPTLLGWPGHEHQWRGTTDIFDGRQEDVSLIYTTPDLEEARVLLDKYGVTYVYVGHRERSKYSPLVAEKFEAIGELAYPGDSSGHSEVVIYRVGLSSDRPRDEFSSVADTAVSSETE
jgi:YYY domain-containing protein